MVAINKIEDSSRCFSACCITRELRRWNGLNQSHKTSLRLPKQEGTSDMNSPTTFLFQMFTQTSNIDSITEPDINTVSGLMQKYWTKISILQDPYRPASQSLRSTASQHTANLHFFFFAFLTVYYKSFNIYRTVERILQWTCIYHLDFLILLGLL